ncbi:MAG: hypothetical protein COV34_00795 [Candidatus Zambryskibacteria bacterium CG10_big_fil_rev_8_21_14_0_10_42_12]|uniref:Right handed beta helix domain-containing protein n=1 Tax=Candidatus Zambryskibacteria bacterium CG10_big_fil_rev_8_21_14_0_10_42_12 TaxID=1975115 RepID=A0A2H0QWF1_9BACT|nr:MAG: hypothetical protein COV34_00795 [Candidatus Zambryskibacteria bacterium CG10_big_fil_rev_8_21_14_0_10_42_12]
MNLGKILLSASMIAFVGAAAFTGTGAFFSDEETSTGNTFTAGAIDLKIDNTSYGFDWNDPTNQNPEGIWGPNPNNTWEMNDLTEQLFFRFDDLKPGDYGEDTISIHVNDNDAWACMAFNLTGTPENGLSEPEADVDQTAGENEGELQNHLSFMFWNDDGDNVLEVGEEVIEELSGLPGSIFDGGWLPLADSSSTSTPLTGGSTHYIGKGWCFGSMTATPEEPAENPNGPTPGNTGFTCDGSGNHNEAQTDGIVVDVAFHAEQSRNNGEFLCSGLPPLGEGEGRRVGALLSAYTAPTGDSCDLTVDPANGGTSNKDDIYSTIQEAEDAANPDDTICVVDGVYEEDVVIDVEGLTLAGDGADNTSVINGQATGQGAAVRIAADNVTVEGFQINGAGIAAVWLDTGVSGAEVRYNQITSASGATAITTQGSQSNNAFRNNVLIGSDSTQIAYVNGDVSLVGQPSDNVDFFLNTFMGTIVSGGVAYGTESTNSNFENNIIADTISSTYAHAEFWKDDAIVDRNNFNGASAETKVRDSDPDAGPLNAENNWWGDTDASDNVAGNVDFDPEAVVPFPEN